MTLERHEAEAETNSALILPPSSPTSLSASSSGALLAKLSHELSSLSSVRSQLPALEGAISSIVKHSDIDHSQLNGTLSHLHSAHNSLKQKMEELENLVKILEQKAAAVNTVNTINSNSNSNNLRGGEGGTIGAQGQAQAKAVAGALLGVGAVITTPTEITAEERARARAKVDDPFGLSLGHETVLLIVASNRPEYLSRCLEHVLKHHPL